MGKLLAVLSIAAALASAAAEAAGPYAYDGRGGEKDWARWAYGPVADDETQQVSFQLLTGDAGADPDMHWAFGLRGAASLIPCPVSDEPQFAEGCLLGRGLAFGHFPDGFGNGGVCSGVAVENFTVAYDGRPAIVAGTCVPVAIRPNRRHAFIISATRDNVRWLMLELGWAQVYDAQSGQYRQEQRWLEIAAGGCRETAGVACRELPEVDQDYGDVFVTSAFLDPGLRWRVQDLRIVHY
jgi:hypothetical protein